MAYDSALHQKIGKYSGLQLFCLAFLRVLVGWHFLYEGCYKIMTSGWSSVGYLNNVPGPFGSIFESMAGTPWLVSSIDVFMMYGLVAIGLALILGLFTRWAAVGAAALLLLFYFSNPPWVGVRFMPGEGNYLFIDKNLVEFAAVLVLLIFPSGLVMGFDRLFVRE